MDYLLIEGAKPLKGDVEISGSKNAALPMIMASILSKKTTHFTNLPRLSDVDFALKILIELGGNVRMIRENNAISAYIDFDDKANCVAPYELVRKMRASISVLGPLLGRYGKAKVSLPGGCAIGARPVDLHIMVVEKLGAKVSIDDGYIIAETSGLKGNDIVFPFVSVGATQAAMMAACVADGTSTISNVSMEPETVELGHMLNQMGAKIEGLGTDTLKIHGLNSRTLPGSDSPIHILPDRIEAGTYAIAAAATRGKVNIKNSNPKHLDVLLYSLKESGVLITEHEDSFTVDATKMDKIKPVDIVTAPYPGFPTDLQAQWMAYMTIADGSSTVTEKIFENRFIHIGELFRLGARIRHSANVATIYGVSKLKGAPVMATDLRASASLIIGALVAEGTTEIHRVYHIDRGYERIDEKLKNLGAKITRSREG
jgi:UDP-N-acetylglucosamine 1-carboxyvinyltransferase